MKRVGYEDGRKAGMGVTELFSHAGSGQACEGFCAWMADGIHPAAQGVALELMLDAVKAIAETKHTDIRNEAAVRRAGEIADALGL